MVRIAICGSIATDHLMTFPGKFQDSIVVEQLDKIALSFLVDDLEVRRGGTAANIAFGLARLGHHPMLVGSVGEDFNVEYRGWLDAAGVDTSAIRVSTDKHTARFVCTTDATLAQIASFYPGAMSEARHIDLTSLGDFDLVLISPDDPDAMALHTVTCRERGIPFAADPSQQLSFAGDELIRTLVDGATYLFTNDYEAALIEKKTGWSSDEVQSRVGTRVVTRGKDGVSVYPKDGDAIEIGAIAGVNAVDPTGVGDSFRAGFLAAVAAGMSFERAAQVGCTIASFVVETTGTQEYRFDSTEFLGRLGGAYGEEAAAEVGAALGWR
jgi:adenosine kinase